MNCEPTNIEPDFRRSPIDLRLLAWFSLEARSRHVLFTSLNPPGTDVFDQRRIRTFVSMRFQLSVENCRVVADFRSTRAKKAFIGVQRPFPLSLLRLPSSTQPLADRF